MRSNVALVLASVLAGGCSSAKVAPVDAGTDAGSPVLAGHVYVVAHEDDDLLFTNPDLQRSIEGGHAIRVVYVTSAGTADPVVWRAREHGVFRPLMTMAKATFDPLADSATYWTCGAHPYAGATAQECFLNQNPRVIAVFLRLPDASLSSLWVTDNGPPFYAKPAATVTSVDGLTTYTKPLLVNALAALFAEVGPERISMLDSTFAYGDDHADHQASGFFALEALHQWAGVTQARIYRAYTMDGAPEYYTSPEAEPANLSAEEYTEKHAVMYAYAGGFPDGSTFDNWCRRQYVISRLAKGVGPLAAAGGGCLDTQGGATADGSPVVVAACDGSAAQRWTLTPDYRVQGRGGKCLTLAAGGAVQLAQCTATAAQKWSLFANGQLRGQNGVCLADNGGGAAAAAICTFEAVGPRRQPKAAQRFAQLAAPALTWSNGTDYSDAQVGALPASYRSLQVLDLDGDGFADACMRLPGGVTCATNGHSLLGAAALSSASFADANGWSSEAQGSTVQYADVDGDKRPDACARSAGGIVCALGSGKTFADPTVWSTAFTDTNAFKSVRFGDVNGDGYADVCGRTQTGVSCALNTKAGAFAAPLPWISTEFTDAGGWNADACSATVQLADVNGDGKADVCGRGPTGLTCATSNGKDAFIRAHLWSFRDDFADAAGWNAAAGYYDSIHFGDVNGDGTADACGRNAKGVSCAVSNGTAFEQAAVVQPSAFTDAQGWLADPYGVSLRLGDIDHDGHADLCGRSPTGLTCSIMP